MKKTKPNEIVKENILRVMTEVTYGTEKIEKVRELAKHEIVSDLWDENLNESFMVSLRELQEEGLIIINNNEITITKEGKNKAASISSKHQAIEKYLMKDLGEIEAHKAAHILEHIISKEVIKNLKRLNGLKGYGVPLNSITSKKGTITDLKFKDTHLFERLVSMGICPGQRIEIIANRVVGCVIRVKNTQIAIANCICNGIMVVME